MGPCGPRKPEGLQPAPYALAGWCSQQRDALDQLEYAKGNTLKIKNTRTRLRVALRVLASLACASVLLASSQSQAVGVAAGTPIRNRASATFDVGGTPLTVQSPINVVTVDEIIDVTVTLQSGTVTVSPGDSGRVLTFLVTNTGNGVESFALAVNSVLPGNQFDPTFTSIYLDDGDGLFDAGLDTLHIGGSNEPPLDANDPAADSIVIFVLNDIPGTASDTQSGSSRLTATSTTSGVQPPGTVIPNGGDGGTIDAIVGTTGAQDLEDGDYVVTGVNVELLKASAVLPHAVFGTQPVPGATIQYTITVRVTGSGTAQNLVVSDPIPADTLYETSSIVLTDGSGTNSLSDIADGDVGDYGATLANGITVALGDVAGGAADRVITFNVMIDPN